MRKKMFFEFLFCVWKDVLKYRILFGNLTLGGEWIFVFDYVSSNAMQTCFWESIIRFKISAR